MATDWYPSDWKPTKLSELGKLDRGRSRHRPRYAPHLYGGSYPFIQTGDIKASGGKITSYTQTYSEAGLAQSRLWQAGTLCITIAANIAETGILTFPACFPDSVVGFIADETKCDIYFVEYMFRYLRSRIQHEATGSVQDNINLATLNRLEFPTPPLPEQRAIAGILGALDDKIELNRRMNRTLESMARAVFRQWFVEGEDVGDWEVGTLGDVIVNFDSKRVPLSKREREQRQGQYPYYGAASIMDYVDDYLFDGIYVLMAEDGSVVGNEDHPVLQYVWGKFWVNNHAHVLQGTNGICNEHLYLFLKDVNILPYVTGAVQPKLNQANMNSIPFVIPPKELSKKFEEFVSPLFAKIRANEEESRTLASLRDSLLPKLMKGEVRVRGL
ncbi:MAG: restriction endonuclease subunit S [Chloroflexota bacterium]